MRPPRLLPAVPAFLIPITAATLAAQDATGRAFCYTKASDPVVYVTPVFDTKLKAASPYRSKLIAYEYNQYIKGRFDYPRGGPFDASCDAFRSEAQNDSARQALELEVAQSKRRVVVVTWAYEPDPAEVDFSFKAQRTQGAAYGPEFPVPNREKGFCVTNSFTQPLYVSAVFDWPPPAVNLGAAEIAWGKYLAAKQGYTGQGVNPAQQNPTYCSDGSRGDPVRMIAARVAGAKAAERKSVETGWAYGVAAPGGESSPGPAAKPKAVGPPPPPSAELREAATKDGAEALTLCQADRMISGALDCYAVQRTVYNYRMANGPGLAVAELLATDKLDCSTCFNAYNADMWATNRAQSNGFSLPKAKCVGPKFAAALKEKPYFNRVKELFEAAMKACPK
jgi:hypothetical protein